MQYFLFSIFKKKNFFEKNIFAKLFFYNYKYLSYVKTYFPLN